MTARSPEPGRAATSRRSRACRVRPEGMGPRAGHHGRLLVLACLLAFAALQAAPALGACTSRLHVVATPHPAGLDGLLTDVDVVPGSRQAWAVGTENRNNLSVPFTDRFVNGRWRLVAVPRSGSGQSLYGVAAVSASDAWAVGDDLATNGPFVEHWDGSSWKIVPTPAQLGSLVAVEPVAADDVWAVGEDFTTGGPLFEHWNGSSWSVFPVPNPFPAVEAPVGDVERVPGTGRLWAVGESVAFQFAHGTWTFSQMPGFASVNSVTIPAQRDVWAVGSSAGGGITEHFDGTRWTKFFTKGLYLGVVASASPHDIWATATDERSGVPLRLAHLNAARSAWTRVGPGHPGITGVGAITLRPDGSGWIAGETAPSGQPQLAALCGL
jgi:hypothetical protein